MFDLFANLGAIAFAVEAATLVAAPQSEASCVLDTLPSPVRQALVEAIAEGDQARSGAALREYAGQTQDAFRSCIEKFKWPQESRQVAVRTFEYDLRREASLIRLRANGLTEAAASAMFEALPVSMHEAIFGKRDMTPEEMDVLQAGFEPLVDRLDGPDGSALSEYITARAGFAYYAQELLSR